MASSRFDVTSWERSWRCVISSAAFFSTALLVPPAAPLAVVEDVIRDAGNAELIHCLALKSGSLKGEGTVALLLLEPPWASTSRDEPLESDIVAIVELM